MKVPGTHHNITSTCSQRANANNFMVTLALTMCDKTDSCKGKNRDNSKNRQFENITISSTRF
jgi:hypothetical protein